MRMETLRISPSRVAGVLGTTIAGLVTANIATQYARYELGRGRLWGLVRLLDVDQEGSLPTWFSTMQLGVCALLLLATGWSLVQAGRRDARYWYALGGVFLYLCADEGAQLHEMFVLPMGGLGAHHGIFYYSWVIPGMVIAGLVFIAFARFLWRLPASTRARFVLGGAIFVTGAIGFEMLNGAYAEAHTTANMRYRLLAAAEEGLEMTGVLVFLHAVLRYMQDHVPEIPIGIGPARPPKPEPSAARGDTSAPPASSIAPRPRRQASRSTADRS